MTKFQRGQKVQARSAAQGMKAGEVFTVVSVDAQAYPWGTVRNYLLENEQHKGVSGWLCISNGHLLLQEVR